MQFIPVSFVLHQGQCDIPAMEKLRSLGGNLGAENQDGRTSLHIACRVGHVNVVNYLLNHGVSVPTKDYRKETPLIDAIEGGHLDIAISLNNKEVSKFLIKSGADTDLRDAFGLSARSIAQKLNHEDL